MPVCGGQDHGGHLLTACLLNHHLTALRVQIQNPQFMYAQSWATGRATGKFMPGDEIRVVNVAEE